MSDVENEQAGESGGNEVNGGNGRRAVGTLTKKDFTSDQEVRWCPGCGDYAILATVQAFMPELGITPDNTVLSGSMPSSGMNPWTVDKIA